MGRIRNPLYLHRYLGFESLSLRHYIKKAPQLNKLRGFFVIGLSNLLLTQTFARYTISLLAFPLTDGHHHSGFLIYHLINQPVTAAT